MNALEADIQTTKTSIVQCLTAYEKHSEQIISQSFTLQLHSILDAISTFDPEQLKLIEPDIKDQVAIKHLNAISNKIKANATQNKPVHTVNPEPAKRQPRIGRPEESKNKETKPQQKKEGFFGSVMKRFASKQKKASQIILPDKEPNCYFDEVKRIWIFQGEQPDVPKEIPKPPSKSEIIKPKQSKLAQEPTEMNNLTAPPEFKRKGASVGATKKVKKQMKTVQVAEQPLVFAKVIQNINREYQKLLEKVRSGAYQLPPVQEIHVNNQHQLADFVKLAEVVLHSSQEIGQYEQKLIEKLNRSISGEGNQLKLLQKILKEVSQSSNIYQRISNNLDSISRQTFNKGLRSQNNLSINQQKSRLYLQNPSNQLQGSQEISKYVQQNNSLINSIAVLQSQNTHLRTEIKLKSKQKDELLQQNFRLKQQSHHNRQMIQQLSAKNAQTNSKLQRSFSQKETELRKINENLAQQIKDIASKLQNIKREYQKLQQAKNQVDKQLLVLQSSTSTSNQKMKDEILKQKTKIQNQLKFYEQKEKSFLKNMKNIQEHTSIIQQFQQTLKQENKLLNAILQQRVQLAKINDYEESIPTYHKNVEEQTSPHTVILELSDIINSITQTHLERLQSFNRNYSTLSKKYQQAKELNKKIKSTVSSQNMSLNRSVSRLKSLIEGYKLAKEEAEDRSSQLELQCQKLKKKLQHYKQQDKFNKSYLSKLKSSGTNNQNESVISLQEDNQELAQTIEDLQKEVERKELNCNKLQNDLEDILNNYEKTQQKLMLVEKKAKQTEKELRVTKDEKQQWLNKINVLQVKLANQKEKSQEIIQRQASRLKSIEANNQKKVKLLKEDLERSRSNEQYLKKEVQQLTSQNRLAIKKLQANLRQKLAQLKNEVQQKNKEIQELLLLVEEANTSNNQKQQQIQQLKKTNEQLQSKSRQMGKSIQEYNQNELQVLKQTESVQNNMIQQILSQYKSFQQEHFDFTKQYEAKIQYLAGSLAQSQEQSKSLFQTINQYTELFNSLDIKIQEMRRQELRSKTQSLTLVQNTQQQNQQLSQKNGELLAKIQQKTQQISELQLLSQQLSTELQRLKLDYSQSSKQNEQNKLKLEEVQGQLHQMTDNLSRKNTAILDKQGVIATLESKLKDLEEQIKLLCNELQNNDVEELKTTLEQKESQIAKLQNQLYQLSEKYEKVSKISTQSNAVSDEKYLKLQMQITQLKKLLQNKQNQLAGLAQDVQNFSRDLNAEETAKKEFEAKYEEARIQLSQIQAQLSQNKVILTELQSKHDVLHEENKALKFFSQTHKLQQQKLDQSIRNYKQKNDELMSRIASLQQTTRSQKIINEEVEQTKNADVEGEMQYLLKEIQDRDTQINQLNQQITIKQETLTAQKKQNQQLKSQLLKLIQVNAQLQFKTEVLQEKIASNSQQIEQLNTAIIALQCQNKQLTELVQNLSKDEQIQQLGSAYWKDHITKLEKQLAVKTKALTELQITQQQSQRLLVKADNQLKQKNIAIADLEAKIAELSQIADKTQFINEHNKSEEAISINQLREIVSNKESQILDLKRKLQEMNRGIAEKENDFELKIQTLEREIIATNSLKVTNKKLEEQYKQLEAQNSSLLSEKVQLMRSNDNLMKINQKLIIQISPHNKNTAKQPKAPQNIQPIVQPKEEQKPEVKSQIRQSKTQKQDTKGFLGTLSSFFLTPTETDRLVKK